jgi:hypothetical protein
MRKMIVLLMVLFSLGQAKERILNTYSITLEADATKANGKTWDINGGAPDILIKVDGVFLDFEKTCKNSYGCSVDFTVENEISWYFEIYDKDFTSNDLIAKGECSVGKECHFSGAKISISK